MFNQLKCFTIIDLRQMEGKCLLQRALYRITINIALVFKIERCKCP